MRKNNFLEKKFINKERTTSYSLKNFHIDFRFKFFNFYNEIIYMKKSKKLHKIFYDLNGILPLNYQSLKKTLSILLTNDDEIWQINKKFRNINKPTNILSFTSKNNFNNDFTNSSIEFHLGDIILSMERIFEESIIENKSFNDHFMHILVHGILHVFGFDHKNDTQRKKMEEKEIKILSNLGIKDPYV